MQLQKTSSNQTTAQWRNLLTVALLALILTQTGCQIFGRFRSNNRNAAPVVFNAQPDKQQLIQHIAGQSAKLGPLQSDVRVSVDGLPTLRGTLAIERPSRLRLKAGLLGVTEMGVDVGSNQDRFWVWTRATLPGQSPALFYANHSDYSQSGWKSVIPLEPQWIIDALGLVDFSPTDHHDGPYQRADGRVEIRSFQQSATGVRTRICAIDPRYGFVNQQAYYDSAGRRVAYTNSINHKYVEDLGVSLPEQIQLHVVQPDGQTLKLVVDATKYKPLFSNSETMWTMPQPEDVQVVDLTKLASPSPAPVTGSSTLSSDQPIIPHRSQDWNRDSRRPLLPRIR